MNDRIVVVSGLPRSGTSMMMRMLEAGGMPLLIDAARPADADNPRGYFEYAPVKRLREDASWLAAARGKAIKVVSLLLTSLPDAFEYDVIFMERDLEEVLASQRAMLLRRVKQGELDSAQADPARLDCDDARLRALYTKHLRQVRDWLEARENFSVLYMDHGAVLVEPAQAAHEAAEFLNSGLDEDAMARAVDASLYRQRKV